MKKLMLACILMLFGCAHSRYSLIQTNEHTYEIDASRRDGNLAHMRAEAIKIATDTCSAWNEGWQVIWVEERENDLGWTYFKLKFQCVSHGIN